MNTAKKNSAGLFSRWFPKREFQQALPEGCMPMTQFAEEDVFIVGYPKSGNTWFQDIVAALAFGALPEFAPQLLVQDLVPDAGASATYYKRYATPMFFKSHALPAPDHKRVVYLLRDGRDAMVSFYHHIVAMENRKVDFLETVQTGKGLFPCKWHEHVQAWLANPFQAKMIVIKYEELKSNTARELQRFCDFAGLKRSPEFLQMIAEGTAFEKMRDKEIKLGSGDPRWPKDKTFRRRGAAGSYKDEMPPEVLSAFLKDSGDTLRQCGYL
jgi:hypothetical protein